MIRTVILTFDDSVISQYENVVPLLKELGFNATFFVCRFDDEWRKKNAQYLMTGEQLHELDSAGFEIGNHTWSHPDLRQCSESEIEREITRLNAFLAENAVGVLQRNRFLCARSVRDSAFRPADDDPMNLPAYSIAGNDPGVFRAAVSRADEENPVILVFHGVPEYAHPWANLDFALFRNYMTFLKEHGYRVCSLKDYFLNFLPQHML